MSSSVCGKQKNKDKIEMTLFQNRAIGSQVGQLTPMWLRGVLTLTFLLATSILLAQAQSTPPHTTTGVASTAATELTETMPRTLDSGHLFLPPYPNSRDRFGFDSLSNDPITNYDVALLHAGWYTDWGSNINPPHSDRLTYAQLVRFKAGSDPYDPDQVTISPNLPTIAAIAAAHPGSLWMLGNEPDSLYQGTPIYPEVYAHVYHDVYYYIKAQDPTALIANGGIVQPTPCRMMYLDVIWDTYQQAYGERMPVDVWNIHAFILREVYGSWGASTPPGISTSCGIDYGLCQGYDIGIFRDNLIAFRQWMKDKGEQDKPLIISEYGILWPNSYLSGWCGVNPTDTVNQFMTQTFDLFLNESYPDVGYPADDYRLVQAWAWYSLSEDHQYNGWLFKSSTRQISAMGENYAAYTAALSDTIYTDLTTELWVDTAPLNDCPQGTVPLTFTLPVTGIVTNLGKQPANAAVAVPQLDFQTVVSLPARYESDVTPLSLPALEITRSGIYTLTFIADPDHLIADPRRWNNTTTVTVDARADLTISTTTWSVRPAGTFSGTLYVTATIVNREAAATLPVSGSLWLTNTLGTVVLPTRFAIPSLCHGQLATFTEQIPLHGSGVYYLGIEVDTDHHLDERDEGNNQTIVAMDILPDLWNTIAWELKPSLTSSGALTVTLFTWNTGLWSADATSSALSLNTPSGTLLFPEQYFAVPALDVGRNFSTTHTFTLTMPPLDIYQVAARADVTDINNELDETNNLTAMGVPITTAITLYPTATTVMTSASRALVFIFPTGSVTTETRIYLVPFLPFEVSPGPYRPVNAFRLLAYRGASSTTPISMTFTKPITAVWHYSDTEIGDLDEGRLDLFQRATADLWERVGAPPTERWPLENRLQSHILHTGDYFFGSQHRIYLPVITSTTP